MGSQHAEDLGVIEAFVNSRKKDEEIKQLKTVRYFHGRSPVWQFSERLGEERAKCKLCGKCFNLPGKSTDLQFGNSLKGWARREQSASFVENVSIFLENL